MTVDEAIAWAKAWPDTSNGLSEDSLAALVLANEVERLHKESKEESMDEAKRQALEAAGWKCGDAEDFLGVSDMMTYSKYPVGPKTLQLASQTESGKLAKLLARVIYLADESEIMFKTHGDAFDGKTRRYVMPDIVFLGDDELPQSVPAWESKNYFETKRLMLAIQDILEAASIREVCE